MCRNPQTTPGDIEKAATPAKAAAKAEQRRSSSATEQSYHKERNSMNREDARREIRQRVPIINYLKKSKGGLYCCPFCGSGEGPKGTGAVKYYSNTNTIACFAACATESGQKGKSYDVFDVAGKHFGTDYNGTLSLLAGELGIEIDPYRPEMRIKPSRSPAAAEGDNLTAKPSNGAEKDFTAYYTKCLARITDPQAASYLSARGISIDTARAYWIGYDPAADPANDPGGETGKAVYPAPRIIIPTTTAHYVGRAIDPDARLPKANPKKELGGGSPGIFNRRALYAQEVREVFVTEGAFDALSVIEAGAAAIALNSTSNAEALLKQLEEERTAATLILCLDNDDGGSSATKRLKEGLQRLNIGFVTANIAGNYNDPNERLQKDREGFIKAVHEVMDMDGGESEIDEFFQIVKTERYKAIPTGIDILDHRLRGGLINEWLVMITAAPGAGKTAFATQICENIARSGRKCVYLNLEMSRDQLIARSLARIIGGNVCAIQALRFYSQTQEVQEAIEAAGETYRKTIAPNMLYNPDNTGADLDRILEAIDARAIRAEAKGQAAPLVCLDYLQLIQGKEREDTIQIIKRAVTELKGYATRHKSIVICISAQSRSANNDREARLDAGRDTSNIEYSSDLQIQIKQDVNEPNTRKVFITKARFAEPSLKEFLAFIFNGKQGKFIPPDGWQPVEDSELPGEFRDQPKRAEENYRRRR